MNELQNYFFKLTIGCYLRYFKAYQIKFMAKPAVLFIQSTNLCCDVVHSYIPFSVKDLE